MEKKILQTSSEILQFSHLKCPVEVASTFHQMFSNEGLKGIIEFILEKQNDGISKFQKIDDNFERYAHLS